MEDVVFVGSKNCIYDIDYKCYIINKNTFKYDKYRDDYYIVLDSSNINKKWNYSIFIMYDFEQSDYPIRSYKNKIISETKMIIYLDKTMNIKLYINFGDNSLDVNNIYLDINNFIRINSNKEIVKLIESIRLFKSENLYLLEIILTKLSNKYLRDEKINLNELSKDIEEYYEDCKLLGL